MSNQYILVGQDTYDLLDAILRGDKEKESELRAKYLQKELIRKAYEADWMEKYLSPESRIAFRNIEELYEQSHYSTNRIYHHKFQYFYRWTAKNIQVQYEDIGKFPLKIEFRAGEFRLSLDWDTDYDQGTHTIMYGISPSDIINEIEVLRKQYVSGECK